MDPGRAQCVYRRADTERGSLRQRRNAFKDRDNDRAFIRRQMAVIRNFAGLILPSSAVEAYQGVCDAFKERVFNSIGRRIAFTTLALWYQVPVSWNGRPTQKR